MKSSDYLDIAIEECFFESVNASELDSNFKKKSGKTFKYLDIKSPEAKKYITKEWINDKNAEIAVCKEDDELAGFIYVNKSGTIAPLKVYEKYRGYGVGEVLFKDAIEKFKGKKLGVYSDNEVAINMYKKYGFVETSRKKYKDGDEVIIMEKKKSVNEATTDVDYTAIPINTDKAKKYIRKDPYMKKYEDYLSNNAGEILVDKNSDDVIGYVFVGSSKDKGFISTLEVKKKYRGQGFGNILLEDAIKKYDAIDLEVKKDNKIAINLYKKYGFKVVSDGRNDNYHYMKISES